MNLFRFISIIVFISTSLLNSFVYAQVDITCQTTPKTCYQAPDEIQNYLSVMDDIIDIVDGIESIKNDKNKWINRITTETEAEKRLISSIITEVIWDTNQFADIFQDFKWLQSSQSLKRDRQKLTDLNSRLVRLSQSLTLDKRRSWESISSAVLDLKKVDDELKKLKYISLAKSGSDDTYNLYNNTYSDLIKLLVQINNFYKTLYSLNFYQQAYSTIDETSSADVENDNIATISDDQKKLTKRIYEDAFDDIKDNISPATIHVSIDKNILYQEVQKIENAYRCASGKKNICDDGLQEAQEKNKILDTQRIKNDSNRAVQVIKGANSRLRWALFSKDKKDQELLEKRQESLDQSQRWRWWPPEKWFPAFIRGPAQSIGAFVWQLWKEFWATTDPIKESVFTVKTAFEQYKAIWWAAEMNNEKNKDKEWAEKAIAAKIANQPKPELGAEDISRLDQSLLEYLDLAEKNFWNTFQRYIIDTSNSVQKDLLHENVAMATKQMVAVSTKVHAAANLLWDYDKQDTINNNMSLMCENQCTNLRDKKCKTKQ